MRWRVARSPPACASRGSRSSRSWEPLDSRRLCSSACSSPFADDVGALRGYFGSYEPLNVRDSVHALRMLAWNILPGPDARIEVPANFLRLYVALPLLIVVPPTFLMGCAFPCLQRVVQTDLDRVGRRVGTLLLANIAGSIVGTVFTGWFALGAIGTATTLRLLVGLSGIFAVAAAMTYRPEPRPGTRSLDITHHVGERLDRSSGPRHRGMDAWFGRTLESTPRYDRRAHGVR